MNDRRKSLEQYSQYIKDGMPQMDEFIDNKLPAETKALKARNLAEETLAHEVLKNTGLSVPDKSSSSLKKEDFLNRIIQERYPELKSNLSLMDLSSDNANGLYLPKTKSIQLDKKMVDKSDITKSLSVGLHEAAHQYDDQILNFDGTEDVNRANLRKLGKSSTAIKNIDPVDMYEVLGKGHHARIPNLRDADSFGLGALKSMMKSGTFKQAAGAIPLVGGVAAAAMSGDASAAVPLLEEAEDVGMSAADEKSMLNEHNARVNYDKSPAHQARLDALKKFGR